jgi:hypothetical protein
MPIFDEFDFYAKCNLGGDDLSFIQGVGLLEFQELMFAASLVCPPSIATFASPILLTDVSTSTIIS